MNKIILSLPFLRATKNKYIFGDEDSLIPALYLPKDKFSKQPATINVTIECEELL